MHILLRIVRIKFVVKLNEQEFIYNQFSTLMGQPKEHMELVSAYFVPTQQGTDLLTVPCRKKCKSSCINQFIFSQ